MMLTTKLLLACHGAKEDELKDPAGNIINEKPGENQSNPGAQFHRTGFVKGYHPCEQCRAQAAQIAIHTLSHSNDCSLFCQF